MSCSRSVVGADRLRNGEPNLASGLHRQQDGGATEWAPLREDSAEILTESVILALLVASVSPSRGRHRLRRLTSTCSAALSPQLDLR